MPTNYTPLTNGQFATAAILNAPLTELDNTIEHLCNGSKPLPSPYIGDFGNAAHDHQDAGGGGQLDAAAIGTGVLDTARIPTLDAAQIGSGVLDNSRVNWAAPNAIGSTTPTFGTFSSLTVSATTPDLALSGTAGNARRMFFRSGTANRWVIYADSTAESGSNAGSNFQIGAYADGGTFLNNYLSITRSNGSVNVPGVLSKGGGSFLIDHPLDPTNRNLIHSFVEGPRADLIYRGRVQLTRGQAQVRLDDASGMSDGTFVALTKHAEADVWVQNRSGFAAVRGDLAGGVLHIECQNPTSTDVVAWLVIAERNDGFYRDCDLTDARGQFLVEVDKPALSADDRKALEAVAADVAEVTTEIVPQVIGKRGYALHARALGLPLPLREIRPLRRDQKEGAS